MSTSDPATIAARYFEVWRAKDLDGYQALLADDVDFDGPMATLHGAAECREGFEGLAGITTGIDVDKVWVDGPDVVTWFRLRTSVVDTDLQVVNWSHVEDGRITSIKVTFDPRPLLG
jgi:ketosteroid isomerase-like protein